jgi:hypothetical protein
MNNHNGDTSYDSDSGAQLTLARLFSAGPEVAPPASLWAAIQGDIDADLCIVDRKDDGVWATTGEGVRTKLLWGGSSLLIQCDIGAVIPAHEHFGNERIIVISGDMIVCSQSYFAGDTMYMPKGSHHGQTTTKTGCLILISYVN